LAIKEFVDAVNLYVTEQEPWKVAKDVDDAAQVERLHTILYVMCDSLRALAVLYNPVMPKAMASLWQQLGANESLGALADQPVQSAAVWGQLQAGATITKGESLFPRLEEAPE
jgi:methionyl-tRNA synthetase